MNVPPHHLAVSHLITTLDALALRAVRRTLLKRLQAHAQQHHLQIDLITMNMNIPSYLESFYRNKQVKSFAEKLATQPFWWVGVADKDYLMLYDSNRRLLWDAEPDAERRLLLAEGRERAADLHIGHLIEWQLPTRDELIAFATNRSNPLRRGRSARLLDRDYWLCQGGGIDLDSGSSATVDTAQDGCLVACNRSVLNASPESFIEIVCQRGWRLYACDQKDPQTLLVSLQGLPDLQTLYRPIDWLSARLPMLETAQFTDPNKGLWEFWGQDAEELRQAGVRARNPADDLKDWNIAIDFGTSSTVVAYDDNGHYKLLRIGVQDFWAKEGPDDYENPTVLELLDLAALRDAWSTTAYRPGILWDDQVRCSHEALHNLRHNETNPQVVASVLTKLKQWALREGMGDRVRITDQIKGLEHELASLSARMPVRGQPLTVSPNDPFDPIELYAWFLGLTINWRGRGLFTRYYLTFPVAYPRDVKEKILASFRRGLQRTLPATLIEQPAFDTFAVEELASEPAAYAAAALPLLEIEPTTEGVAYAVFDFGGGTADFDFGRYRLPDTEEEDEGWEVVFEHFGTAGDPFLGGENLLENLAYRTFRHNLELCRENKIAFTRPLDADDFPGSEMFLERTQAAQTNTLMLIARLRPFWEQGALPNKSGVEKIALLARDGGKVECEFAIPEQELHDYLEARIEQGVYNFLAALRKAFAEQPPQSIHVLLAGNASRSALVARLFALADGSDDAADTELEMEEEPPQPPLEQHLKTLFGEIYPRLQPHPPLPIEADTPYRPTAKTGVALGLLHLCPGGVVKVVNHAATASGGEAPFAFYVGRERRGRFQVGLPQGTPYGVWHELGMPRDRVFNLYYTQLPSAHTGEVRIGEPGLYRRRIDLQGDLSGHKLFAQAIGPDQLEICTAVSGAAIADGECANRRTLSLE